MEVPPELLNTGGPEAATLSACFCFRFVSGTLPKRTPHVGASDGLLKRLHVFMDEARSRFLGSRLHFSFKDSEKHFLCYLRFFIHYFGSLC